MRTGVAILLFIGILSGYAVTSARAVPIGEQSHDCDVSKAFGMFRAVTSESWLLFEDKDGTLRAVDYGCHLQRVINRR
jgi:hypothetical protein